MTTNRMTAALALMVCVAAAGARADDAPAKVDNPLYAGWAKYKVGSTATYEINVVGVDGKSIKKITVKSELKSITKDGVTIVTTVGDNKSERTIPAKIGPDDVRAGDDKNVAAMAKTFKCKTWKVTSAADGESNSHTKSVSISDDVVGGVVRLEDEQWDKTKLVVTVTAFEAK